MKYKNIISTLCSITLLVIFGCAEELDILTGTLEITDLSASQSIIGAGETTLLEATVSYSGDETVLMYTWKANAGSIGGSGNKVTYIAPNNPGTYTISLVVTDGVISDGKTIDIQVAQQSVPSITLDINTHWPATDQKDKLAYNVNVKSVESRKVLLYYDITQDQDIFDVFLSIQVGQRVVLEAKAIGAEQPSTAKRTIDDIDVTNVITGPGRYIVTFYVSPGNRAKNGWLLNEARIIGVQGTSDPQQ